VTDPGKGSRMKISAEASRFLGTEHTLLIDGDRPVGSAQALEILDPSTGEALCSYPMASAAQVNDAVNAARRAFKNPAWAGLSGYDRAACLYRLADLIEAHAGVLAELESLDFGMPISLSRRMVAAVPGRHLRYCAGWSTRLDGATKTSPFASSVGSGMHAMTLREPVGVVAAITPWNSPLLMAIIKLAPALACGCTLVLKPAELTPLSAEYLAGLIAQAGFPPGVVNMIPGTGAEAGAALTSHPGVDKIAFTGSSGAARSILSAVAGTLTPVALELGGKAPAIVCADADLERALAVLAGSCSSLQGQSCAAVTRIYAEAAVFGDVLDGLRERLGKLRLGHALDESTTLGPLVSAAHHARVMGFVDGARADGATVIETAATQRPAEGYFLAPVLVTDTSSSMAVVREEIFGPVIVVESVTSVEEAIERANDSPYGLFASVWSRNIDIAHSLVQRLEAGFVAVNGAGAFDASMPFGGVKQSGWGREFGEESVAAYTHLKTVAISYNT